MGAPSSDTEDPFELCGETIDGKYRVRSVVGAGGFGVVYRGVHGGFGEPIAVKCLRVRSNLTKAERDDLLTKLQDEGRVLHRLSKLSSGIVQALDVGAMEAPNGQWVPYLILEWLEGKTLSEHIAELKSAGDKLSLPDALALLSPAAKALAMAHKQKVAHRDVKPENLYMVDVGEERTMKVLDFGIAKVLTSHTAFTAAPAATVKQASAFTPSYGAPEQFNKKRGATGPWTDVFALALILVELVSGERALAGDDATQLYIAAADPASRPTLRYHGVETTDAVEDVLEKALAIDPGQRFQDAGAFWDALCKAADAPTSPESTRTESKRTDVSATGEYVSKHDIDLEPADLSDLPESVEPSDPDRPTRVDKPAPAKSGAAAATALSRDEKPAEPEPAPASDPPELLRKDHTKPRAIPRSEPRPKPPEMTEEPLSSAGSSSSKWMPVVGILALGGAAALYMQLRQIEPPPVDPLRGSTSGAKLRPIPPVPGPVTGPTRSASAATPSAKSDGGAPDAGAGGAGPDAGAGGTAKPAYEPPSGMAYMAASEDAGVVRAFFLDQHEVRTGEYKKCVSGGECPPAVRIVLTPEAAGALGIPGVDDSTTAEGLTDAWGGRCNATRGKDDHPINCVKYGHAADFCRWQGKRLPTSAEWMLAAKGIGGRKFPWGDTQPECDSACFGLNGTCLNSADEVATCTSGSREKDKTPQKFFDLGGNVSEWVADKGKPDAHGQVWRGVLGGNFASEADGLMSRRSGPPSTSFVSIGFRCALTAPDDYKPQ